MSIRTLDELVDEIKKEFVTMPSEGIRSDRWVPHGITPLAVHQSIQHDQIKKLITDYVATFLAAATPKMKILKVIREDKTSALVSVEFDGS